MKEIHQALIALGPLIATTVFSLRAKEKQELVPLDNLDSERRHGIHDPPRPLIATTVLSLRAKEKQELVPLDNLDSERRHGIHDPPVINSPDVFFRINKEENLCLKELEETGGREEHDDIYKDFPLLNADISLRKEEPASIFIDHLGLEVRESSTDPISAHEVVSFHIKDEEEPYCMNRKSSTRPERISRPMGTRGVNIQGKDGAAIQCTEKTPPFKAPSRKAKVMVQQSSRLGTSSNSQLSAETNWELGGETMTHCQRGSSNPTPFILHQGASNVTRSDTYNQCQTNLRNAARLTNFPNMQESQRPYTCTECKKSFSLKGNLIAHKRTHTGEKPYPCSDCQKSFSRRSNLNEHRLYKHTGVRPYQCTECEMSFTRKNRLIKHRRLHTGT